MKGDYLYPNSGIMGDAVLKTEAVFSAQKRADRPSPVVEFFDSTFGGGYVICFRSCVTFGLCALFGALFPGGAKPSDPEMGFRVFNGECLCPRAYGAFDFQCGLFLPVH